MAGLNVAAKVETLIMSKEIVNTAEKKAVFLNDKIVFVTPPTLRRKSLKFVILENYVYCHYLIGGIDCQ